MCVSTESSLTLGGMNVFGKDIFSPLTLGPFFFFSPKLSGLDLGLSLCSSSSPDTQLPEHTARARACVGGFLPFHPSGDIFIF